MSFQAIVSCHVVCIVCHAIRSMSLIFGRIYLYACRLHGILTIEDLGFACLWAAACFLLSPGDSWRTCFRPWLLSSSLVVDWLLSSLIFDISPGQALSNPFVLLMIELFDLSLTDASWWLSTNWRTASRIPCRRWHGRQRVGRGAKRPPTGYRPRWSPLEGGPTWARPPTVGRRGPPRRRVWRCIPGAAMRLRRLGIRIRVPSSRRRGGSRWPLRQWSWHSLWSCPSAPCLPHEV